MWLPLRRRRENAQPPQAGRSHNQVFESCPHFRNNGFGVAMPTGDATQTRHATERLHHWRIRARSSGLERSALASRARLVFPKLGALAIRAASGLVAGIRREGGGPRDRSRSGEDQLSVAAHARGRRLAWRRGDDIKPRKRHGWFQCLHLAARIFYAPARTPSSHAASI